MKSDFICIEGNIGVGKTTLVRRLAEHFKTQTMLEEFDENPWLPLFYKKPKEIALALELSFLTERAKQLTQLAGNASIISDYCIDKCLLFAEVNLSADDYKKFAALFSELSASLKKPSLVVVIHTPLHNLLENIRKRNRSYEQAISPYYLENLNHSYKHFFNAEQNYTVLNIHTNEVNEAAYETIFNKIVSFIRYNQTEKTTHITI